MTFASWKPTQHWIKNLMISRPSFIGGFSNAIISHCFVPKMFATYKSHIAHCNCFTLDYPLIQLKPYYSLQLHPISPNQPQVVKIDLTNINQNLILQIKLSSPCKLQHILNIYDAPKVVGSFKVPSNRVLLATWHWMIMLQMFCFNGEKHLNVGNATHEWKVRLAMKMVTLGFLLFEGRNMMTWCYEYLTISFKTKFQFYNNLVVGAKFLSTFGKFSPEKIIGWDFLNLHGWK